MCVCYVHVECMQIYTGDCVVFNIDVEGFFLHGFIVINNPDNSIIRKRTRAFKIVFISKLMILINCK